MAKITRFYDNLILTTAGLEVPNIIGAIKNIHTGIIDQIIISESSGSATEVEVQIRYEIGNDARERLAYLYEDGTLPLFVDSHIDGPFSLFNRDLQGDIHLFLRPNADCTVNLRIDIEINNISGL